MMLFLIHLVVDQYGSFNKSLSNQQSVGPSTQGFSKHRMWPARASEPRAIKMGEAIEEDSKDGTKNPSMKKRISNKLDFDDVAIRLSQIIDNNYFLR